MLHGLALCDDCLVLFLPSVEQSWCLGYALLYSFRSCPPLLHNSCPISSTFVFCRVSKSPQRSPLILAVVFLVSRSLDVSPYPLASVDCMHPFIPSALLHLTLLLAASIMTSLHIMLTSYKTLVFNCHPLPYT